MTQIAIVGSNTGSVQTMTSLEIVELVNKERMQIDLNGGKKYVEVTHANFLKKVREVLAGGEVKFYSSYLTPQNKEVAMYSFPKREATLMAMSYSPAISAAVYDKMTALEEVVASQTVAALPNFSNPAEAARAWALEYERSEQLALVVEQKEALLIEQAPKVEYVEKYIEDAGSLGIRAASKVLQCNERELGHWLVDQKLAHRHNPSRTLTPYATAENRGLLKLTTGLKQGSGEGVFVQMRITNKGMTYLRENLPAHVYKTHN